MKKLLITYKISPINIILIVLLRIIGYRVNYFEIAEILKKKIIISFLYLINIERVDYNKVTINNGLFFNQLIKYNYKISKIVSNSLWSNNLKKIFLNKNNFNLCIADESLNNLKTTIELISYKNFVDKKIKLKSLLILVELNLQNYLYFTNYFQKDQSRVVYVLNIMKVFFISIRLIKIFLNYIFPNLNTKEKLKKKECVDDNKFLDSKVLFFPHHGVFNTRIDKKYYYSKKYNYLNPKNILHIEFLNSESKFLEPSVLKFYKKNSIKNICWENIEKKLSNDLIIKTVKFSFKNIKKINLLNFFLFIKVIHKLFYHLKILDNFKKVKVILVGQADFFPNILSIASRIRKIKTFSFQNRLVGPPMLMKMKCIDNYFCVGEQSKKNLSFKFDKNMRLYKIFFVLKNNKDILSKQSLKIKKCLIAPYSINPHWFNNGRQIVSNNNNVEEFLNKIILIIKNEKKINFFIKFKSNSFKTDSKVNNLVKKLKKFKNVKIGYEHILKQRDLNSFDLVVGQPSSLIETCIASNIPSLIYEKNESYREYIICNDKKIFCNYEDIINKFDFYKKKFTYCKQNIKKIRNKLFFKYNPKKLENIKKKINQICK